RRQVRQRLLVLAEGNVGGRQAQPRRGEVGVEAQARAVVPERLFEAVPVQGQLAARPSGLGGGPRAGRPPPRPRGGGARGGPGGAGGLSWRGLSGAGGEGGVAPFLSPAPGAPVKKKEGANRGGRRGRQAEKAAREEEARPAPS